ncbi:hemerythrin HHE cation-binding protein [Romeria aff. gracilis LEGE 07310]|uniref:Hemerythrin HHE cation-binding protein n=1 Tax=Vasconcelosia minhoensis LEGE 07310 TaxID=915328 RepID=A0A8J7DBR1_9CYAN|nr:hemerythrin HHE cation-binding protein [Romeria gracilis]MBE9076763.1 hemerythrin HHE cation-binding protein [Romeria aff. gracilis LEGE 07310]
MADMTTLATKLADLKLFQNVLIEQEQKLMAATDDSTIRERLEGMLKRDRENLGTIETAIAKSGTTAESRDITQKHAEKVNQMMSGSELTLYDKFFQLELLKHQQTMTGLVLHKVAQSLDDTLQNAMEPLNKVNFENRAHQEVLKGVLYFVGTREMAGKEPDMGLWASVEQGIAALKGAVGSAAS